MDAEIKAKWVEALRSGKYRQGKGYLRQGAAFCCLGVLCDIVDPGAWKPEPHFAPQEVRSHGGCVGYVPLRVEKQAGVSEPVQSKLVHLNDADAPFSEIADFIETNL